MRARASAVLVGMAVVVAMAAGCSTTVSDTGSHDVREAPHWKEGATVESVAAELQVQVPATATDARAAHQEGFQDDGLILAFVLPNDAVEGFLAQLEPRDPLRLREQPHKDTLNPTTPFSHLGVPDPDLLGAVREGTVCGPCKSKLMAVSVAVARVDDQSSRVYLRGFG
ncbi:hypothetical protein AB0M92_20745 [Streptomyces sp. NPDC051582]|uniref:hypothetical protein n=1 Tax=Streptomyces sp. NPDC051582 TaxID=3155167 RepID=UPI003441A9A6